MTNLPRAAAAILLAGACVPITQANAVDDGFLLARLKELREAKPIVSDAKWTQPGNITEQCRVYQWGGLQAQSVRWLGSCQEGKASGLGVVVTQRAGSKTITLEEYGRGGKDPPVISYRGVFVSDQVTYSWKGRVTPGSRLIERFVSRMTPKGNLEQTSISSACGLGECVDKSVDVGSGDVEYRVSGESGYAITWKDFYVASRLLYGFRSVAVDGGKRAQQYVFDGTTLETYREAESRPTVRTKLSPDITALFAQPAKQVADRAPAIAAAVSEADAKFERIRPTLCSGQRDADIQALCESGGFAPLESRLAAGTEEIDADALATYELLRSTSVKAN